MADCKSIGGAFDALQQQVFALGSVVRGYAEVARQVGGDQANYPEWLEALLGHVESVDAAMERLQPEVFKRTPEGRAARKALASLPRRAH